MRKFCAVLALVLVLSLITFSVYAAGNNVSSAYKTPVDGTSDADTDNDWIEVTDVSGNPKDVAAKGISSITDLPANAKAVDVCDIHWHSGKTALDADTTITLTGTNVADGTEVYVLHQLSGKNKWVKYSATNKGSGTIEFTVPQADGLSPFVILDTSKSSDATSPSTGDVSRFIAVAALTCAVAAAGVLTSSFRKEQD